MEKEKVFINDACVLQNVPLLDSQQSRVIYRASYLICGLSFYGFIKGKYDLASIAFCGFLTSINYWRNPVYGLRRNIDRTAIPIGLIYHAIRAYKCERCALYYSLSALAVAFYPASWYYYNKKKYWTSTYLHCTLHVIANVTFYILYSGAVAPIRENPLLNWLPADRMITA
jgi:hypothetical protein